MNDTTVIPLPSSLGPPEAEVQFTKQQRDQLRASVADIERHEFTRFVTAMLKGHDFPSPDTVESKEMPEGSRVRASDRDYLVFKTGWRADATRKLKCKSQVYLAGKRKADKYGDKRISAEEAGSLRR